MHSVYLARLTFVEMTDWLVTTDGNKRRLSNGQDWLFDLLSATTYTCSCACVAKSHYISGIYLVCFCPHESRQSLRSFRSAYTGCAMRMHGSQSCGVWANASGIGSALVVNWNLTFCIILIYFVYFWFLFTVLLKAYIEIEVYRHNVLRCMNERTIE